MADAAPPGERLLVRFGRSFTAGEVLFREGEDAKEAFLLQEGRVRLIKRMGALERSLRVLRPGDLFGEAALTSTGAYGSTAVALSAGAALALDQGTFQQVLSSSPQVAPGVVQQLARRLREAEDQIELLMLRDSRMKVVVALLKLAQQSAGGSDATIFSISPLELSVRVGLDVETVKRNVQQLRDGDYVRIADERIEIPDIEALRELHGLLGVKDRVLGGTDRRHLD